MIETLIQLHLKNVKKSFLEQKHHREKVHSEKMRIANSITNTSHNNELNGERVFLKKDLVYVFFG